ncbi:MAG: hypothetical protein EZS28_051757, partial [Streblomastix strix]
HPPTEFIRLLLSENGWPDLSSLNFGHSQRVIDTVLVSTLDIDKGIIDNNAFGGRDSTKSKNKSNEQSQVVHATSLVNLPQFSATSNALNNLPIALPVSMRLLRHFFTIQIPEPDESTLQSIYKSAIAPFGSDYRVNAQGILKVTTDATVSVYKAFKHLFPSGHITTPNHIGISITTQNISRILEGVLMCEENGITKRVELGIMREGLNELLGAANEGLISQQIKQSPDGDGQTLKRNQSSEQIALKNTPDNTPTKDHKLMRKKSSSHLLLQHLSEQSDIMMQEITQEVSEDVKLMAS